MSTGFNEPLINSPRGPAATYAYRSKAGLVPSAEYAVYFNDFFENPSSNAIPGTTAIIDTGATITAAATDAISYTGVLSVASDGATEGATMYWPKGIQLGLGKKFFMEVRAYTEAADDTDVQFGLSIVNATTNPEDVWTTAATDLIAFGVLDGSAYVTMLCDKNNAGTSALASTVYSMSNSTWHTLGIEVTGTASGSTMGVKGYLDGQLAVTWGTETSVPDDAALAPFIGARNGSSTGNAVYFDYVRWSLER